MLRQSGLAFNLSVLRYIYDLHFLNSGRSGRLLSRGIKKILGLAFQIRDWHTVKSLMFRRLSLFIKY